MLLKMINDYSYVDLPKLPESMGDGRGQGIPKNWMLHDE